MIDNIMVDEIVETADQVIRHLTRFRLTVKQPESLKGEVALGLRLEKNMQSKMMF